LPAAAAAWHHLPESRNQLRTAFTEDTMPGLTRAAAAIVITLGTLAGAAYAESGGEVWKTESCTCCSAWIDHMAQHGFALKTTSLAHGALSRLKSQSGVPAAAASCHTAKIGGYVIEGHVPADDVKRLLAEKPDATGLAVAGMPAGSPGMESANGTKEPFEVLLIKKDGSTEVFARHGAD
jgi:hypothetical protein